ncbi:MAG: hypothetical protein IKR73_07280 [Oscillospiraceae bacterium]|nr:hypothetical protein [Oscillospiraceae bacterium]
MEYTRAEIEIVRFDDDDIMTTSGTRGLTLKGTLNINGMTILDDNDLEIEE